MNLMPYLLLALCGAGFYVLFTVWRASRARGDEGSTLVKKLTKWFLLAGVALGGFVALTQASSVESGPALLALVVGMAGPVFLLRRKREAEEGAEGTPTTKPGKGGKDVTDIKVRKPGKAKPTALAGLARKVAAPKVPTYLDLGMPVPVAAETAHFLVAGTNNSDKAAALGEVLEKLRARGDTAIVVDAGGDLVTRHFAEDTDFIFNPYDERCVSWSPLRELQGAWDAPALARSIVPDGVGDDRDANALAQSFVDAVLRKLADADRLTTEDFLYWTRAASLEELQSALAASAVASSVTTNRALGAVRGTLSRYLASYDCLLSDGEPFSVAAMIQAEHSGVLFATYRADQTDTLRYLLSSLVDVAARAVLALEPSAERRVWLIVDDVATLGRIPALDAFISGAHKTGGCLVLGVQALAPLVARYGSQEAQTLVGGLANRLTFRIADADAAAPLAALLGDAEELAGSLAALSPLHGVLKLSGDQPASEVEFPRSKQAEAAKAFVPRDFRQRPMLRLAQAKHMPTVEQEDDADLAPAPVPKPPPAPAPAPVAKPAPAPKAPRHATRQLLREDPREAREALFGDDVEAVAQRARQAQEELRQRAEALGIPAWTQGEYDVEPVEEPIPEEDQPFVPVFAHVPVQREEGFDDAVVVSPQPLATEPAVEVVEAAQALPQVVVEAELTVEPLVIEMEPVAEVEPLVVSEPLVAPQPEVALRLEPEPDLEPEVAPVIVPDTAPAPTPAASREPRPAQRPPQERRDRQDRPARPRQPSGEKGPQAPAPASNASPSKPRNAPRGDRTENKGDRGAGANKPAAPKSGKAHDMLKDLLR